VKSIYVSIADIEADLDDCERLPDRDLQSASESILALCRHSRALIALVRRMTNFVREYDCGSFVEDDAGKHVCVHYADPVAMQRCRRARELLSAGTIR